MPVKKNAAKTAVPTYKIQVLVGKNWRDRTTISQTKTGKPISSANHALKAYGIHGTRPRLGEATSRSGKRFRAFAI